jgi:uncharacterized protein YjbJ (UPF0337 family)
MGALTDKIKGKAKEIEGRVTGDRIRTAQGKAEKTKADIEGAIGRVTNNVRGKVAKAKAKVTPRARKAGAR